MLKIVHALQGKVKTLFLFFLDLIFPHLCLGCQKKSGEWLCPSCAQSLTLSYRCEICMSPLEDEGSRCRFCKDKKQAMSLPGIYRVQSLFEKEKTIQSILDKISYPSYYPLVEVLASYLLYSIDRVKWPTFSKVISQEKELRSLATELHKIQKKGAAKTDPILVLVRQLPYENDFSKKPFDELRFMEVPFMSSRVKRWGFLKNTSQGSAKREVYLLGLMFDQS